MKDRIAVRMIDAAEAVRRAAAGRDDRRADVRQHRHRAGHRRPAARLPLHLRLPGQGQPGQDRHAARLRRRGGRLPDRGRARGPALVLLGLRPAGPRDARRLEAGPVRQPEQPALALRDHRPGAVGADRRADHPLRRRRRHRRHDQRRRPLPQGARAGAGHRRRPGGLGVLRRHRAVPYLVEGVGEDFWPATYDRDDLRRDHRRVRRRLVRDDPPAGPRGGAARRRLVRHGRGRRARGGASGAGRTTSSSCCCPTAAAATCRRSSTTAGWPTTASCSDPGEVTVAGRAARARPARPRRWCTPTRTRRCARRSTSCASTASRRCRSCGPSRR